MTLVREPARDEVARPWARPGSDASAQETMRVDGLKSDGVASTR